MSFIFGLFIGAAIGALVAAVALCMVFISKDGERLNRIVQLKHKISILEAELSRFERDKGKVEA